MGQSTGECLGIDSYRWVVIRDGGLFKTQLMMKKRLTGGWTYGGNPVRGAEI